MIEHVLGIDVGTHKSAVWAWSADGSVLGPIDLGDDFGNHLEGALPSYALVDPMCGSIKIGLEARQAFEAASPDPDAPTDPCPGPASAAPVATNATSAPGATSQASPATAAAVVFNWKMHLLEPDCRPAIYAASGGKLTPEGIFVALCRLLSRSILERFGDIRATTRLALTFPATGGAAGAAVRALHLATWRELGWNEIVTLQEPLAIAQKLVALHEERHLEMAPGMTLIVDLGGGTSDLALLELTAAGEHVLRDATALPFAGRDLDLLLAACFGLPPGEARRMKEGLTFAPTFSRGRWTLSQQQLREHPAFTATLRQRLLDPLAAWLRENLGGNPLARVYVAGGSSRFFLLRELLTAAAPAWGQPLLHFSKSINEVAEGAVRFASVPHRQQVRPVWTDDIYLKLTSPTTHEARYQLLIGRGEALPTGEIRLTLWPSKSENRLEFVVVRRDGGRESVVLDKRLHLGPLDWRDERRFTLTAQGTADFRLRLRAAFDSDPDHPFFTCEEAI